MFASREMTVNAVAPDIVTTPMSDGLLAAAETITAQILSVDGGMA